MVQSVELLLDPGTDEHIRQEWRLLTDAGLPSQGRHTGASNRPHITMGVAGSLDADQEERIAGEIGARLPLTLRLAGLLIFGAGPFVLARAVVPTQDLLDLQQRVASHLLTSGSIGHQQPGGWTAHVTLARRLDAHQLAAAVAGLSPIAELSCRAVAVRRWDGDRKVDWLVS